MILKENFNNIVFCEGDDGTDVTADTYYYYFRPMGARIHGLEYILFGGAGTLTVEASMCSDKSYANIVWDDVTNTVFGSANMTASGKFVDYQSKLTPYENVRVKLVAADGKQINSITCVADDSDSLDGTWFTLYDDAGSVGFWIDTDNSGTTCPAACVAATDRQVEITTIATDDDIGTVGTAVYNAVTGDSKFEAGSDDTNGNLTIQASTTGDKTPGSDTDTGFTIAESYSGLAAYKIFIKQAGV